MASRVGQVKVARETIENNVLSQFSMTRISINETAWSSTAEYSLVFPGTRLDELVQDLCKKCKQEASKLNCSAKCETKPA
jgi:hypothetical protein